MPASNSAKGAPVPKNKVWKPRRHRVDLGDSIAEELAAFFEVLADHDRTSRFKATVAKVNDLEMHYADALNRIDVAQQALDYAHGMLTRIAQSTGAFVRNMDKVPDGTPIEAVRKPMMPAFSTLDGWANSALADVGDAIEWLLRPTDIRGDPGPQTRPFPPLPPRHRP